MIIDRDINREDRQIEITGLRGLAIMLVVSGHLMQRIDKFYLADLALSVPYQFALNIACSAASGVYLFFAISGYLIGRSLSRIQQFDTIDLLGFYVRRALRIAPPYLIVLVSTWLVLSASGWIPQRTNLYQTRPDSLTHSLLASAVFLHEIIYGTFPRLFPPGWTVEVEVQFYVLSPMLCLGLATMVNRWSLGAAAAWMLSAGGLVALVSLATGIEWLQHCLPVFLPLFLLGMVSHTVRRSGWRPSSWVTPALGWPAFVAFAALQPCIAGMGTEIAARMALIAVMFAALASGRGAFFRLCTHPALQRIGVVSYSAYLVHMQIMQVVFLAAEKYLGGLGRAGTALVAVPASILMIGLVTAVFYSVIEKPLLGYVAAPRRLLPRPFVGVLRRRAL